MMITLRSKLASLFSTSSDSRTPSLATEGCRQGIRGAGPVFMAAIVAAALAFFAIVPGMNAQTQMLPVLQTYAGNGTNGAPIAGPAISSPLNSGTTSVALDRSGNLYIGMRARVVRVDARTRQLTLIAGTGVSGYNGDNIQATTAQVSDIEGMVVDPTGANLYISDYGNNRIRSISLSTGIITTVVGTGTAGYNGEGNSATAAQINGPTGLVFYSSGGTSFLVFSDYNNNRIRALSAGGIYTLVGTGTVGNTGDGGGGTSATLSHPAGLAVDPSFSIYWADTGNCRVRKFSIGGTVSNVVGSASGTCGSNVSNNYGLPGAGTAVGSATLQSPWGLAFDSSGNLYVSDSYNNAVYIVAAVSGAITTSSTAKVYVGYSAHTSGGYGGDGSASFVPPSTATVNVPYAIAVDGNGTLYIADSGNYRVRTAGYNLQFPQTAVGSSVTQKALFAVGSNTTLNGEVASGSQSGTAEFTLGTPSGCTNGSAVAIYALCYINITYTPQYPGVRTANLGISTAQDASFEAPLVGTATGPLADFSSGTQSVVIGNSASSQNSTDSLGNLYYLYGSGICVITTSGVSACFAGSMPFNANTTSTGSGNVINVPGVGFITWQGNGTTFYEYTYDHGVWGTASATVPALGNGGVYDAVSGAVYVGTANGAIYELSPTLQKVVTSGTTISDPNGLCTAGTTTSGSVTGMAVDPSGNLYSVSSSGPGCVVKYAAGTFQPSALFTAPANSAGIAVDPSGGVYLVTVPSNNATSGMTVQKYALNTSTGLYAGVDFIFSPAYAGDNSTAYSGGGITIDSAGNLFVQAPFGTITKYTRTTDSSPLITQPAYQTYGSAYEYVENNGTSALTLSSPSVTSPFLVSNGCSTLAAGSSCQFVFSASPTTSGTITGTGTITDNSAPIYPGTTATQIVNLSVTATADVTTPSLTSSSPSTPSTASTTLTATVTNSTNSTTPLGTVTFNNDTLGTTICNNVTLTSGTATCTYSYSGLYPGSYTLSAHYTPSSTGFASSAIPTTQVITSTYATAPAAPTTPVRSTSAAQTVTFTFPVGATLGSISAVTWGFNSTEFSTTGGTCTTGTAYTQGQTCTVTYTFSPLYPGLREGAIRLLDNASTPNVIAETFISGTGTAPLALYTQGSISVSAPASSYQIAVASPTQVYTIAGGNLVSYSSTTPTTLVSGVSSLISELAVDGNGNIYGWSYGATTIYELPAGGSSLIAIATSPAGVDRGGAVDSSGNLYIGLNAGGVIKVDAVTHAVTTLVPNTTVPSGGGTFQRATGLAVDAAGDLFVSDYSNNAIYEVVSGSSALTTLAMNDGLLNGPHGIAVDPAGNLYVTNYNNATLLKYAPTSSGYIGVQLPFANTHPSLVGVTIGRSGTLYITDGTNYYVYSRSTGLPQSFSSVAVGSTSAVQLLGFENDGNQPLVISQVGVTSSTPFAATGVSPYCNGSLAAGGTCNISFTFSPTAAGSFTSVANINDNSNNAAGGTAHQSTNLYGTTSAAAGTTAQTITFPQPTTPRTYTPGLTVGLAAYSSSGLAVTYTVTSGSATVSGTTLTPTGPGSVTVTANQPGNATYSAAPPVSVTVVFQATTIIQWAPAQASIKPNSQIGSGNLDAVAVYASGTTASGGYTYTTVPGTLTYAAQLTSGGSSTAVTSTSTLAAGFYYITATFTPTNTSAYTSATATIRMTVAPGSMYVANINGTVSTYAQSTGAIVTNSIAGGGTGLAVAQTLSGYQGYMLSGSTATGQTSVKEYSDSGTAAGSFSYNNASGSSSTSGLTAMASDGGGNVWFAQSETVPGGTGGDLAKLSNTIPPQRLAGDASIGTPTGIAVDSAGSIWVTSTNNTVIEVIGLATPVTTSLAQALANGTLAKQP